MNSAIVHMYTIVGFHCLYSHWPIVINLLLLIIHVIHTGTTQTKKITISKANWFGPLTVKQWK